MVVLPDATFVIVVAAVGFDAVVVAVVIVVVVGVAVSCSCC